MGRSTGEPGPRCSRRALPIGFPPPPHLGQLCLAIGTVPHRNTRAQVRQHRARTYPGTLEHDAAGVRAMGPIEERNVKVPGRYAQPMADLMYYRYCLDDLQRDRANRYPRCRCTMEPHDGGRARTRFPINKPVGGVGECRITNHDNHEGRIVARGDLGPASADYVLVVQHARAGQAGVRPLYDLDLQSCLLVHQVVKVRQSEFAYPVRAGRDHNAKRSQIASCPHVGKVSIGGGCSFVRERRLALRVATAAACGDKDIHVRCHREADHPTVGCRSSHGNSPPRCFSGLRREEFAHLVGRDPCPRGVAFDVARLAHVGPFERLDVFARAVQPRPSDTLPRPGPTCLIVCIVTGPAPEERHAGARSCRFEDFNDRARVGAAPPGGRPRGLKPAALRWRVFAHADLKYSRQPLGAARLT